MKKSRFSEQQIAFILRQAEEGTTVEEVCRKAGISEATYYNWRKKYGGPMPSEMKRLKQLEEENQRLKKLVADLSLDKEMLQDVRQGNRGSFSSLRFQDLSDCRRTVENALGRADGVQDAAIDETGRNGISPGENAAGAQARNQNAAQQTLGVVERNRLGKPFLLQRCGQRRTDRSDPLREPVAEPNGERADLRECLGKWKMVALEQRLARRPSVVAVKPRHGPLPRQDRKAASLEQDLHQQSGSATVGPDEGVDPHELQMHDRCMDQGVNAQPMRRIGVFEQLMHGAGYGSRRHQIVHGR
jgi:putative transposase